MQFGNNEQYVIYSCAAEVEPTGVSLIANTLQITDGKNRSSAGYVRSDIPTPRTRGSSNDVGLQRDKTSVEYVALRWARGLPPLPVGCLAQLSWGLPQRRCTIRQGATLRPASERQGMLLRLRDGSHSQRCRGTSTSSTLRRLPSPVCASFLRETDSRASP